MELHNFEELKNIAGKSENKKRLAIASAADIHILETALEAFKENIVEPILVGNRKEIEKLMEDIGAGKDLFRIVESEDGISLSETAVKLIHAGEADMLMKGMMETSDFLRPIVNKEHGLGTGRVMSHVALQSIPGYPKLVINTDAAMCPSPDLTQKKEILLNAVDALHALGYEEPKVACLCCKETYDKKMPETVDARALQEMCEEGKLGKCHVVGPISYDIAISREIAQLKNFNSPYCGDFDVLLEPNIHAGNILGKCLEVTCKASMAGIVSGAKVPVILTSRGAAVEEKLNSIAFAAAIA